MSKKFLVLSPHADDEVLGCGGTISKYSRDGCNVNVLYLPMQVLAPQNFLQKILI